MIFGESYKDDDEKKSNIGSLKTLSSTSTFHNIGYYIGFRVLSNETCSKNLIGRLQKKRKKVETMEDRRPLSPLLY